MFHNYDLIFQCNYILNPTASYEFNQNKCSEKISIAAAYFKTKPVGKRAGPIMRESLGIQRTKRAEEQKNTNQVHTLLSVFTEKKSQ